MGAGIGVVVAGLGAYVAAAYRAETQTSDLNKAILQTGGAAGVTTGQLSAMAVALSDGVRSGADIHDALIAVTSSGKFAGDQIQTVAKAALDMADVTGQSVQQAVAQFTKLGEDPVTAAVKLNQTYHFLTDSVYDQIRALEQQGNTEDATRVAVDALAQAMDKASTNVQAHIGVLHGMWNELKRDLALPADLLNAAANQATPDAAGQNAVAKQMLELRAKQGYFTQDANGNFTTTAKFSALRPGFQSDMKFYLDMYNRTRSAAEDAANAAQALADKQKDLQGVMSDQNWVDTTIKGYDKVKDRAQAAADVSAKLFNLVLHGKALPEGVHVASGSQGGFAGPGFDYLVNKEMGGSGSSHTQTANLERARQRALDDIQAQIKAEGKIYDQQAKQKAAAIAYASGLEDQTKTRQAQLDLQLQSVGMSDREIQQAQALLQIREQYNRAVQQINSQRNAALAVNPKADVSGFDSELAAQKRNLDAQTAQQKAYYDNLLQVEGNWRLGAERGMKQFMDNAADVAG